MSEYDQYFSPWTDAGFTDEEIKDLISKRYTASVDWGKFWEVYALRQEWRSQVYSVLKYK